MSIQTEKLKRVFIFNDLELEDPNENMNKEEVLNFYSTQYPELTNSNILGPEIKNDRVEYRFNNILGSKG